MRGGWVESGTVLIRLTRAHFAFFRGYLEGLDLHRLAAQYLENATSDIVEPLDLRVAKSSVEWIRRQLMVATRRSPTPSNARLFVLSPEKLTIDSDAAIPTLDEYREQRDPHEFYSEDELIALFADEYGSVTAKQARRLERNGRLRIKQLHALVQLEALLGADPKLTDGVDGWLDPILAQHLRDAGIRTLSELVATINARGYRWYSKVPRIGEKAAAQITKWLTEPSVSGPLGITLHPRGVVKRRDLPGSVAASRAPETGIVPLEHFVLPTELNGAHGTNRGERPLLSARHDLDAINAWLTTCKPGSHTLRSYRKECERFLLWSILEKGKPISSLTVEDCIAYRDFLWHIGRVEPDKWAQHFTIPQARWVGPRGAERWSVSWRPFEGPLSAGSQKTALVIVQAMLQWLTEQDYLHGNPMKAVRKLAQREDKIDTSRALSVSEWDVVQTYLAAQPSSDGTQRLRFILALAYGTGLRLSELVSARKADLQSFERGSDGMHWQIVVTGKGGRRRVVQTSPALIRAVVEHFRQRGYQDFDWAPEYAPLIAALPVRDENHLLIPGTTDKPLSASGLYKILKRFFVAVATWIETRDLRKAMRLKAASTHWLRHSFATHALQGGVSLEVVRGLLGHRSLDTTSVYINAERDRASRELEALWTT